MTLSKNIRYLIIPGMEKTSAPEGFPPAHRSMLLRHVVRMLLIGAVMISGMSARAQEAQEGDVEIFRGISCDAVGSRAGEIMTGKLAGVPLHQAVRDMDGTALDAALIVSAYDQSHQPEVFQATWVARCGQVAIDVPEDEPNAAQRLFAGRPCEAVRDRAGTIMIGRMGGLSWDEAWNHLRKSDLDGALINDAYSLPRPSDTSDAFQQQEDFQNLWGQRCELMRL